MYINSKITSSGVSLNDIVLTNASAKITIETIVLLECEHVVKTCLGLQMGWLLMANS